MQDIFFKKSNKDSYKKSWSLQMWIMLKINRGWTLKRLRRRIYVCHVEFKNKSVPSWSSFIKDITYIINKVGPPYYCLKFYNKKSEAEIFFPPKFEFENISWSWQWCRWWRKNMNVFWTLNIENRGCKILKYSLRNKIKLQLLLFVIFVSISFPIRTR